MLPKDEQQCIKIARLIIPKKPVVNKTGYIEFSLKWDKGCEKRMSQLH